LAKKKESRLAAPGMPYHVVTCGVDRCELFASDAEIRLYVERFTAVAEEELVTAHAGWLLEDHLHWVLTAETEHGLANLFRRVHTWWAMYYNQRHGRVGPLFENRYHAISLGESDQGTAVWTGPVKPPEVSLIGTPAAWMTVLSRKHWTAGSLPPGGPRGPRKPRPDGEPRESKAMAAAAGVDAGTPAGDLSRLVLLDSTPAPARGWQARAGRCRSSWPRRFVGPGVPQPDY
jgi:REP element-mobilizing transposase RayT